MPIYFAARAIMGEEKLEEWIHSDDLIWHIEIDNMENIRKIAEQAGYDFLYWTSKSYKTHFRNKKSGFFTWERRENGIIACMSIHDDEKDVRQVIERMEMAPGRKLFISDSDFNIEIRKQRESQPLEMIRDTLPTIYTDQGLLEGILLQYKIEVESSKENNISCQYSDYKMTFQRTDTEKPFDMMVETTQKDMRKLQECMKILEAEYYASLQEQTYMSIREQILEEGMKIEEEQVMEDNSIVLTVSIE